MKILVFDTETTGLNPHSDYILELAWAIYEVDFLGWRLLTVKSDILAWDGHPVKVTPLVEQLTGISAELVSKHGNVPGTVLKDFWMDVMRCQYVAGMNIIKFDTPFVNRALTLVGEQFRSLWEQNLFGKGHVDLWFDLPLSVARRALKYMALDHDYVLMNAHRGISDVLATAHILGRYPIEHILEKAVTPLVHAAVTPNWNDKAFMDQLYHHGFRWMKEKKQHEKELRAFDLKELPFQYRILSSLFIGNGESAEVPAAGEIPAEAVSGGQLPLFLPS